MRNYDQAGVLAACGKRFLASHLKALEKEEYILVNKSFLGRKPNTNYEATAKGKKAFKDHLDTLEQFIKQQKPV